MAIYIVTYIVPLIFIEMNFTGLVVSMVLFVVVGLIFIRSDKDYLNPTFLFLVTKHTELMIKLSCHGLR
jgi:hypothetical protein